MEKHRGWDLCELPIREIIDPVFPLLKGARLPQFPQCDYSRIVWVFPPVGGAGLALAQHILWSCRHPASPSLFWAWGGCGAQSTRWSWELGYKVFPWLPALTSPFSTRVYWFFWVRCLSCRTLWALLTRWCSKPLAGKQCLWDEILLVTDLSVQTRGNDPSRKKTILKIQTGRSWIPLSVFIQLMLSGENKPYPHLWNGSCLTYVSGQVGLVKDNSYSRTNIN